jgi:hypothetical protein
MSELKIKGKVKVINPTQVVSEKFKKREFVITTEGEYGQDILFQLTNDKVDWLNDIQIGGDVEVLFNVRGREWQSPQGEVKYFTTLEAWRINKMNEFTTPAPDKMPWE